MLIIFITLLHRRFGFGVFRRKVFCFPVVGRLFFFWFYSFLTLLPCAQGLWPVCWVFVYVFGNFLCLCGIDFRECFGGGSEKESINSFMVQHLKCSLAEAFVIFFKSSHDTVVKCTAASSNPQLVLCFCPFLLISLHSLCCLLLESTHLQDTLI